VGSSAERLRAAAADLPGCDRAGEATAWSISRAVSASGSMRSPRDDIPMTAYSVSTPIRVAAMAYLLGRRRPELAIVPDRLRA